MNIIAHRGYWLKKNEQNSVKSFIRALKNDFGIEIDLRDHNGHLVVAHEPANTYSLNSEVLVKIINKYSKNNFIALNIKSSGLRSMVSEFIKKSNLINYCLFDLSIPDLVDYSNHNLNFFSRLSEFEKNLVMAEKCDGIWLDSFHNRWFDVELIKYYVNSKKKIIFVSPELHKRNYIEFWSFIKNNNIHKNKLVFLCTDFPLLAKNYFNE